MEYRVIKSKFGNDMLYVPSEKMLYKWKGRGVDYECYQKCLSDKKLNDSAPKCFSSVRRVTDRLCERVYVPHTDHTNHEDIVNDKELMNNMIAICEDLRSNYREDAHRIPTRHIFQREMAKYNFLMIYI